MFAGGASSFIPLRSIQGLTWFTSSDFRAKRERGVVGNLFGNALRGMRPDMVKRRIDEALDRIFQRVTDYCPAHGRAGLGCGGQGHASGVWDLHWAPGAGVIHG